MQFIEIGDYVDDSSGWFLGCQKVDFGPKSDFSVRLATCSTIPTNLRQNTCQNGKFRRGATLPGNPFLDGQTLYTVRDDCTFIVPQIRSFYGTAEKSWCRKNNGFHFFWVQHGSIKQINSYIAPFTWYHKYYLAANWMIILCYKGPAFYQNQKKQKALRALFEMVFFHGRLEWLSNPSSQGLFVSTIRPSGINQSRDPIWEPTMVKCFFYFFLHLAIYICIIALWPYVTWFSELKVVHLNISSWFLYISTINQDNLDLLSKTRKSGFQKTRFFAGFATKKHVICHLGGDGRYATGSRGTSTRQWMPQMVMNFGGSHLEMMVLKPFVAG